MRSGQILGNICMTGYMTLAVDILCGSSAYWERGTVCTVCSIPLSWLKVPRIEVAGLYVGNNSYTPRC